MEFLSNPWYKQTFGSKLCRLLKLLPDSDLAALVLQMYRFFHNFQLKNNKQKNPQLKSGKHRGNWSVVHHRTWLIPCDDSIHHMGSVMNSVQTVKKCPMWWNLNSYDHYLTVCK